MTCSAEMRGCLPHVRLGSFPGRNSLPSAGGFAAHSGFAAPRHEMQTAGAEPLPPPQFALHPQAAALPRVRPAATLRHVVRVPAPIIKAQPATFVRDTRCWFGFDRHPGPHMHYTRRELQQTFRFGLAFAGTLISYKVPYRLFLKPCRADSY